MAFIGSINGKLRKFFATHAALLDGRDVYVGCSGNFTLEQILTARAPAARLFSNDVSLYSCALGHLLTDQPFRLQCVSDELAFLNAYIARGAVEKVAVLLMLTTILEFEKRNNEYRIRMWEHYLANFDRYFEQACAKVRDVADRVRLVDYTMADVYDFYPRPGAVSVGFLPTYVGGYEKLFKSLDAAMEWDRPAYEILTQERREETIQKMAAGDFILYDDQARDDMPCVSRCSLGGKRDVFIYSNLPFPGGLIRHRINEKVPKHDILMPDEEIPAGSEIRIVPTDLPTVNHYRNMYLSKKITPGAGGQCFLLFVGGKMFGVLMFLSYSVKLKSPNEIYLMSDFTVPSNRHRRLSKLALLVALSADMRLRLEKMEVKRYRTVLTSVFTDKPVSMKYRGVFKLVKRGDNFLNYRGEFTESTLKEVMELWQKKHDK